VRYGVATGFGALACSARLRAAAVWPIADEKETNMNHNLFNWIGRSWLSPMAVVLLGLLLAGCTLQTARPPGAGDQPAAPATAPNASPVSADADAAQADIEPENEAADDAAAAVEATDELAGEPADTAGSAPTAAPTVESSSSLAIANGTLIDGTGADPIPQAVVIVEGGIITAVGPEEEVEMPDGITTVDAGGGTILPGIIETRSSDLFNEMRLEDDAINEFDAEVYLYRTLRSGVTTVLALGWEWQAQQNLAAVRAALDAMGNTIPTIRVSGTGLAHGEGAGVTQYYNDQLVGASTEEEAIELTERLIALGVDQINVAMAVGPEIQYGRKLPILSLEQLQAIVETAHAHERRVVAQAIFPDEVETVLAAGVDQLGNWPHLEEPMTAEMIVGIVAQSVPVVSGFSVERPLAGDVRRFLDAGGTLIYGTFAPNAGPLNAPYNEFQRMALLGEMSPMEIIVAATADAAAAIGMGEEIGTLETGKMADIIIVNGDPLQDLRVFRDGVTAVIKGGELVRLE
jgi:imidazolonepropionase-like amidohydrolase